jgi:hypothetical protein
MMAVPGDEDEQRQGFRLAFEAAVDLDLEKVWINYFGIGGRTGLMEVQAYVYGALSLPPIERDLLAHALNESLDALGFNQRRATYSRAIFLGAEEAEEGERGTKQ